MDALETEHDLTRGIDEFKYGFPVENVFKRVNRVDGETARVPNWYYSFLKAAGDVLTVAEWSWGSVA